MPNTCQDLLNCFCTAFTKFHLTRQIHGRIYWTVTTLPLLNSIWHAKYLPGFTERFLHCRYCMPNICHDLQDHAAFSPSMLTMSSSNEFCHLYTWYTSCVMFHWTDPTLHWKHRWLQKIPDALSINFRYQSCLAKQCTIRLSLIHIWRCRRR